MKKIAQLFLLSSVCFLGKQIGCASFAHVVGNNAAKHSNIEKRVLPNFPKGKQQLKRKREKCHEDSMTFKRAKANGESSSDSTQPGEFKQNAFPKPKDYRDLFLQFSEHCKECISAFEALKLLKDMLKEKILHLSETESYWFRVEVHTTTQGVNGCVRELQGYYNIFKAALDDRASTPDQSLGQQVAVVSCLAYCDFYSRMMLRVCDVLEPEPGESDAGFIEVLEKTGFYEQASISNLKNTLNKRADLIKPFLED